MPDYSLLSSLLPDIPLRILSETRSTNDIARHWLMEGAGNGSMVLSSRQSGGRGRMGRVFCSEEGGLYMSLVLRSDRPAGEITTLCAVAVCQAVREETGLNLQIKWVNDALLNGKKVCGILCEGVWMGSEQIGLIAGIGLNVSQKAFPPELCPLVASLYPDGTPVNLHARLAAAIHRRFFALLPHSPGHMDEYRSLCVTLGQDITWVHQDIPYSGTALAIENDGALKIRRSDGKIIRVAAGEVSIRPAR